MPKTRKVSLRDNAIESLNMTLRKVTKTRGSFPNDDALLKILDQGARKHRQEMDEAGHGLDCDPDPVPDHSRGLADARAVMKE